MTELTDEEVYQEIGKIVSQFKLYQCYECALEIKKWLINNGIEGTIIKLQTACQDEDYIISDRIGNEQSITMNGRHYGVLVRKRVFDNLSSEGLSWSDWLKDFSCQSSAFIINELRDG